MTKEKKELVDTYQIQGYEMLTKTVFKSGTQARISLPANWIGKKVKIIRVE